MLDRTTSILKYDYFRNARGQQLRFATGATLDPKGLVLILPGRTEFIEKYQETVTKIQDRGYAVAVIDWIDHGLSDRSLPDRIKCHATDFAHYVDDLTFWINRILPGHFSPDLKRIGLGSSMGGHIGFRGALEYPKLFNALAMAAPMFGIHALHKIGHVGSNILTAALSAFLAERCITVDGESSFKARANPGDGIFSHDPQRDRMHMDLCQENPKLRTGDPTFGWVHAAVQSCHKVMQADLSTVKIPVLLAIAGAETVVENEDSLAIGKRLPAGETLMIEGAGHEILMETDGLQKPFWAGFDRLLDRTI